MLSRTQVAKRLVLWAEPIELPTSGPANIVVGGGEDTRTGGEFAFLAIELPGVTVNTHLDAEQLTQVIAALLDLHCALIEDPGSGEHEEDSGAALDARVVRWADHLAAAVLTDEQAEGHACVACGRNWLTDPAPTRPSVPIGFGPRGGQVFVCASCDNAQDAGGPR
ncbi:hypothetical protein [Nocardia beijingensis]|uniref:hypothetical protein n=1 Tax=Nocardia beijingensis TaxID=95162 RepID=UPI0033A15B85